MTNIALIAPRIVYNIALVDIVMTVTEVRLSNQPPGGHPFNVVTLSCETVKVLGIVSTAEKEYSNDASWAITCLGKTITIQNTNHIIIKTSGVKFFNVSEQQFPKAQLIALRLLSLSYHLKLYCFNLNRIGSHEKS